MLSRTRPFLQSAPWRHVAAGRRALSVGSKSGNKPAPTEPSQSQAMPLGKFYEYILNEPQPIPDVKPEQPPVTAAKSARAKAAGAKEAEPAQKKSAA